MILDTGQGKIYVRKSGRGEPLLLLHGNGEDSTIFQELLPYFEQHFTVYAMDTRGHGMSELKVEQLTFQRIARDILFLLDEQKIDRIQIIGYSDGGNIGLYLAVHHPERVKSLITLGANFAEDGLVDSSYQEILQQRNEFERLTDGAERQQKLAVHLLMLDELDLSKQDLEKIQAPVLVMAGEFDLIQQSHTEELAEAIPDAELLFIPNGGHDFFVSDPQSLIEAATLFFQSLEEEE